MVKSFKDYLTEQELLDEKARRFVTPEGEVIFFHGKTRRERGLPPRQYKKKSSDKTSSKSQATKPKPLPKDHPFGAFERSIDTDSKLAKAKSPSDQYKLQNQRGQELYPVVFDKDGTRRSNSSVMNTINAARKRNGKSALTFGSTLGSSMRGGTDLTAEKPTKKKRPTHKVDAKTGAVVPKGKNKLGSKSSVLGTQVRAMTPSTDRPTYDNPGYRINHPEAGELVYIVRFPTYSKKSDATTKTKRQPKPLGKVLGRKKNIRKNSKR